MRELKQMSTDSNTMNTANNMVCVLLPSMSLEDLQRFKEQLEVKQEKCMEEIDSFPRNQENYTHSIYSDYREFTEVLQNIEVELVRREEKLSERDIPELETISHECYRKVKHMQNYHWDTVEDSSEGNRKGFWAEICYLEKLESAANIEIERREGVVIQ